MALCASPGNRTRNREDRTTPPAPRALPSMLPAPRNAHRRVRPRRTRGRRRICRRRTWDHGRQCGERPARRARCKTQGARKTRPPVHSTKRRTHSFNHEQRQGARQRTGLARAGNAARTARRARCKTQGARKTRPPVHSTKRRTHSFNHEQRQGARQRTGLARAGNAARTPGPHGHGEYAMAGPVDAEPKRNTGTSGVEHRQSGSDRRLTSPRTVGSGKIRTTNTVKSVGEMHDEGRVPPDQAVITRKRASTSCFAGSTSCCRYCHRKQRSTPWAEQP